MRVIVVDDNADIVAFLTSMLEAHDVEVVGIHDHIERTFLPETWDGVDAAIVDWMMPGVNGLDLLDHLQKNHPEVRRVLFSAVGAVTSSHLGHGVADAVLPKPASMPEILEAIGLVDG